MPKGQRGRGNIADRVDRDLLHDYMWKHSDHNHLFQMSQKELAEKLGVTVFTMSTISAEMVQAGRLRKVKWNFFVIDPELWRWKNPPAQVPLNITPQRLL